MSGHASQGRRRGQVHHQQVHHRVDRAARRLADGEMTRLRELLSAEQVQRAVEAEGVSFRVCLFTPLLTLWTFLAQVLSADGSCRDAVAKLLASLAASGAQKGSAAGGDDECAPQTGPYCKARQRLAEGLISRLACETGRALQRKHPAAAEVLGGRPVKIVDGATASMPDTAENQQAYPQPPTQKPGLGFPLVRMVAVLSLSCAVVLGLAAGPYAGKRSGETALFRKLIDEDGVLEAGDILLADRYYASYWMIALLSQKGVDSLFRQHQKRSSDFRTGRRLGKDDHLITLKRPTQRPDWMDEATYASMPEQLSVREVRVRVTQAGFRVRELVLVTTLLDAELYSKQEITEAFRLRWHVELDLRAIKQTMHMSVLRCKTPEMVRKEIWMHLLAYNLVRTVMAEAAAVEGIEPREVSFAGAVQTLNAFAPVLQQADEHDLPELWKVLLRSIARHRVGDRPNRCEPRAVKRRAKPIALLTVPRQQARARLARTGDATC